MRDITVANSLPGARHTVLLPSHGHWGPNPLAALPNSNDVGDPVTTDERLVSERFPRSSKYGVQVWATDLWFSASHNFQRVRDANVADGVFPIHADARSLPFATEFFDAIVCIDSFVYYGTDDLYLNYLARFLKPGGSLGVAGAGLMQEIEGSVPDHLQRWWEPSLCCLHSALWWRRHWERTGILDIDLADTFPNGWQLWRDWQTVIAPDNAAEIQALEADQGSYLGYVRLVGRRRPNARLDEPIVSISSEYVRKPLPPHLA
jgi:SAM-dependent methyltransferase